MAVIAEQLKKYRTAKKLSQETLAEELFISHQVLLRSS